MRYVFRLSPEARDRMDAVAPPANKKRSPFLREALLGFLSLPPQPVADRPHIPGKERYVKICAILDQLQLEAIKSVYPSASVSVVIQAAVLHELRRSKYRGVGQKKQATVMNETRNAAAETHNPRPTKRKRLPQGTREES